MSNQDLFKQAIAEAKTIREAAIANAKEALEESLTPHLKDMLAAKLQEMEDKKDEELMDENIYEAEEEEVETEEGEEKAKEEAEEEDIDVKDMSVEELKDLIRDIVAQEVGDEEGEEELPEEDEGEIGADDMQGVDGEEEIDINEILAELAEMDEYGSSTMKEPSDAAAAGLDNIVDAIKAAAKKSGMTADALHSAISKKLFGGKRALPSEFGSFEESVDLDEYGSSTMKEPSDAAAAGAEAIANTIKAAAKKAGMTADALHSAISKKLFGGKRALPSEFGSFEESKELEEALATIGQLRTQLQEVNLLNAKLLYVNKVFKANNLTEGQKVNVVAAFDKAETVKEVKLVYETVSKNVVSKPVAIKEHKSFASKAAGTATVAGKKEVISEVNEQVARWQKLAGIIK